jgi:hypothetical protein
MKGLGRAPVPQTAWIRPGAVTTVTLELPRIANLKAQGWFSGSNHVYMYFGGNLHNTPENLIFIASAEENDVIGEKVANKDNRIFDHQYFTGRPDKRSTAEHLLFFDEEYRLAFY